MMQSSYTFRYQSLMEFRHRRRSVLRWKFRRITKPFLAKFRIFARAHIMFINTTFDSRNKICVAGPTTRKRKAEMNETLKAMPWMPETPLSAAQASMAREGSTPTVTPRGAAKRPVPAPISSPRLCQGNRARTSSNSVSCRVAREPRFITTMG